jgi:hypothetical protein
MARSLYAIGDGLRIMKMIDACSGSKANPKDRCPQHSVASSVVINPRCGGCFVAKKDGGKALAKCIHWVRLGIIRAVERWKP